MNRTVELFQECPRHLARRRRLEQQQQQQQQSNIHQFTPNRISTLNRVVFLFLLAKIEETSSLIVFFVVVVTKKKQIANRDIEINDALMGNE